MKLTISTCMTALLMMAGPFAADVHGQQTLRSESVPGPIAFGVEIDVLPYATGGYFGAAWAAKGPLRLRALHALVHMPEFVVQDGFTNNDIDAFAVLVDVFPDGNGIWFGGGLVYWMGSIQSDARRERAEYDSSLLNGGIGYVHYLTRNIYLSPWTGLSVRVAGDADILVDGQEFRPPRLNPEASVKFGWVF
ncbi:MAG: hypothetical protein RIE53_01975 [Rhodothermales bacterium]